jgi:hypothetical protein
MLCPGSLAASELRGRNIKEYLTPPERNNTIAITEHWLRACNVYHQLCRGNMPTPMPKRVVDIRNNQLKLLETSSSQCGLYAALSYSWGDDSPSMPKLNKANLAALQVRIRWSDLRLSHQQGIEIARELNRTTFGSTLCASFKMTRKIGRHSHR